MKDFRYFLWYTLISLLCVNYAYARSQPTSNNKAKEEILLKEAITKRNFVFHPQTAHPLAWRSVNLSYGFFFGVSPDTISAYLPYYGRSYKAPISPDENGVVFVSTDFDYQVKEGKNGRMDIKIVPKDVKGKQYVFYLSAFPTGNCSLSVQDPDRQHIHFNGIVELK